jgi:hypothetical protein
MLFLSFLIERLPKLPVLDSIQSLLLISCQRILLTCSPQRTRSPLKQLQGLSITTDEALNWVSSVDYSHVIVVFWVT